MATPSLQKLVTQLRRAAWLPAGCDRSDGQLVGQFLAQQDQEAFAALVRRHGPMVLGVCRRVLDNVHDADDAFQATFLILVHKAASLKSSELVGNWLYGVAYRTALAARRARFRRRSKEKQVIGMPEPAVSPADDWSELRPLLDQELSQLTELYRQAIVLCDLEGKTRKEAARLLGVPESTLSGRLTTARRQLAQRLTRHGLTLSAGAVATVLSHDAVSACVPAPLVASTVQAATLVAAGSATAGVISASVIALTEGVLKTMFLSKVQTLLTLLLGFVFLATCAAGLSAIGAPQQDNQPRASVVQQGDKKDEPKQGEAKKDEAKKDEPKKDEPKKDDDVRVLEKVEGIEEVTLEGKSKKLLIKSIEGASKIDCGKLEVEEIEIESLNGAAQVTLKLADKAKLNKLTIGTINGAVRLDCSQLEVVAVTIGQVNGAAEPTLQATGNITIQSVSGAAKVSVTHCRNLTVDSVSSVASVTARYSGEAKVQDNSNGLAKLNLKKIDPPK